MILWKIMTFSKHTTRTEFILSSPGGLSYVLPRLNLASDLFKHRRRHSTLPTVFIASPSHPAAFRVTGKRSAPVSAHSNARLGYFSQQMERDDQQETENRPRRVAGSNALPGTTTIIFTAPDPRVELEDVVRGLMQPLRQGEWRFVFIPNDLLADVVRELRNFLALESVQNALVRLSLDA